VIRPTKWQGRFIDLAKHVAGWSKDPSTQVGSVVVRPNNTILSVGYNGLPRGMADDPEALKDRDYKLAHTVHAEVNAILNSPERPEVCSLYVWPMPPCTHCASLIIQSGVTHVYSVPPMPRWEESCKAGRRALEEAGVVCTWFGDNQLLKED
jgi:dCMP deaminase